MNIIKYTDREGGYWIEPNGELAEDDILSVPIWSSPRGYLWGFIHSYIRKDNKRFDAFNDGLRWIKTELPLNTKLAVAFLDKKIEIFCFSLFGFYKYWRRKH